MALVVPQIPINLLFWTRIINPQDGDGLYYVGADAAWENKSAGAAGNVQNGANVGVGGKGVFAGKAGTTLDFKNLNVAGNGLTLSATGTDITITDASVQGAANVGVGGEGVYSSETGAGVLQLKNINVAGNGLSIGSTATDITITNSSAQGAANIGVGGQGLYASETAGGIIQLKNLNVAGTGVAISANGTDVTVTGSAITAVNGTVDEIIASTLGGVVSLSTPQGINITSSPTFAGLTDTGLTVKGLVYADNAQKLQDLVLTNGQLAIGSTGAIPVAAGITGTSNQVIVTNGAGSVTLSAPQNIDSTASPTFAGLTLTSAPTLNNISPNITPAAATASFTLTQAQSGSTIFFGGNSVTQTALLPTSPAAGTWYEFVCGTTPTQTFNITAPSNICDVITYTTTALGVPSVFNAVNKTTLFAASGSIQVADFCRCIYTGSRWSYRCYSSKLFWQAS